MFILEREHYLVYFGDSKHTNAGSLNILGILMKRAEAECLLLYFFPQNAAIPSPNL